MKFILYLERIFAEKFAYLLQKQLSKSVGRQLTFLIFLVVLLVFIFGSIFYLLGVNFSQGNVFWFSILSLLGPDSLYTIDKETSLIKGISLFLNFIGIIIFNGIIIAIVVSTIHSYFDEIRRGTGKVYVENALVILGWNGLIPAILAELNIYCKTESKKVTIVILTESPSVEYEQLIKINRYVEILFRTGSVYKISDLKRINIIKAKSILAFYDGAKKELASSLEQDSYIIKTFIALKSLIGNAENTNIPILLNFNEIQNSSYLKYLESKETIFFNKNYYNAKFISLLLFNPAYYSIFHELLSYEGNEIYFYKINLAGKKFSDAIVGFVSAIPIGIRRNGKIILVPSHDFYFESNDEIIFITNSEKSIQYKESELKKELTLDTESYKEEKEEGEVIAIVGMNSRILYVIEEFEKIGKKIYIYANEREIKWKSRITSLNSKQEHEIFIYPCEFISESEIMERIPLERFDKILVLAPEQNAIDEKTIEGDTDTLFKILKLIHLKKKNPEVYRYQILCEIENPENEDIVRKIPESNFNYVLGNLIVSKILTMELLNKGILEIYEQLLQKGGVDIEIKPLLNFFAQKVEFQSLKENIYGQKRIILLGYIESETNKILLCPEADNIICPQDQLIYLIESEYSIKYE